MTVLTQPFDGAGAAGDAVTWDNTDTVGDPVWLAGTGAAILTTDAIHGTHAAAITNAASAGGSPLVLPLPASTKELVGQAYLRLPTDAARADHALAITYVATSTDGVSLVVTGERALKIQDWNGPLATQSADAIVPGDGSPVRVAWRVKVGDPSTVNVAVFAGESTAPLWETSTNVAGIADTAVIENLQFGPDQVAPQGAALTVIVDSIRATTGTGSSAAWLAPENPGPTRRHHVWVLTATGWRNLGTGRIVAAT